MKKLTQKLFDFISAEKPLGYFPPCDLKKIETLIQPGDVLLIQGLNRLSASMEYITKSIWTHAALCVGKLENIKDETLKQHLKNHYKGKPDEILLIQGIVGKVTSVITLSQFKKHHVRLCRPNNITKEQLQQVLTYAISSVGHDISFWQVSNLIKLLFYWHILPGWLFKLLYKPRKSFLRPQLCSSLLAEAFKSAKYPILPTIIHDREGKTHLIPRDTRLFFPAIIDYSPCFDIIKYPLD